MVCFSVFLILSIALGFAPGLAFGTRLARGHAFGLGFALDHGLSLGHAFGAALDFTHGLVNKLENHP